MLTNLTLLALALSPAEPRPPAAPGAETAARPLRWLDLDADGDLDALLLRADGALRFLRNDGRGSYSDETAQAGLEAVAPAAALLTGDVDGDGRVDLVVGGITGLTLWLQEEGGAFLDVTAGSGLAGAGVIQALEWVDLDADGQRDLHAEGPEAHVVFRAEGPARFRRLEQLELGTGRAVTVRKPAGEEDPRDAAGAVSPGHTRSGKTGGAGLSLTDPAPAAGARATTARASRALVGSTPTAADSPLAMLGLPGCIKAMSDQGLPGSCIEASSIPTLGLLHPLSIDFNIDDATGHVGMGTTSPTAGLHMFSRDGLLADGDLFQGGLAMEGTGTRMLWYPKQAVFRAGNVTAAQWDLSQLGPGSAAFGENTIASGLLSFAAGGDTTSSGNYSVAFGDDTIASGNYSAAMGDDSVAEGTFSVAGGQATRAGYAGTAFGRFNVGVGSASSWVDTDPLFELGNGTSTVNRSNAFTVLKNGSVGVGTAAPASPLHVIGRVRSTGAGAGFAAFNPNNENASAVFDFDGDVARIRIGGGGPGANGGFDFQRTGNASLLRLLDNGNVGIGTTTPTFDLEVNGTAGKPGGGSWSVASDARLKRDVEALDGALEQLLELRGVSFEYRDPDAIGERAGRQIGFIAQEVEQVFPQWVGEKDDGMKFVSVSGFEALAVEALRELEARTERIAAQKDAEIAELVEASRAQQATIEAQLERIAALEARVGELATLAERLDELERAQAAPPARR